MFNNYCVFLFVKAGVAYYAAPNQQQEDPATDTSVYVECSCFFHQSKNNQKFQRKDLTCY
jgi:hypothetical protein